MADEARRGRSPTVAGGGLSALGSASEADYAVVLLEERTGEGDVLDAPTIVRLS